MTRNQMEKMRIQSLLDNDKVLQETYYVVNGFLNTLSRFSIWNLDIEAYSGWRPAVKRLSKISRRYYEEMLEASEIQGKGKT